MRQDDTYEFIGVWDEQYKRVGFEADIEGRPISRLTRCKDCKYHHEAHYEEDGEDPIIKHKCKLLKGYQFSENHYCRFAERKEECLNT